MTGPRRKKFLDASQITGAITEAAAIARKQHVRVALAGGCAMQIHGSDRLTAGLHRCGTNLDRVFVLCGEFPST